MDREHKEIATMNALRSLFGEERILFSEIVKTMNYKNDSTENKKQLLHEKYSIENRRKILIGLL